MPLRKHPGFNPKPVHLHEPLRFPKGFLWGSATSAHQVEGWNDNSDWWEWEHMAGTIADGQLSGRAADHYHLFRKDFETAAQLGQNAHRFSIEWARVCPEPGVYDQAVLDHYREVIDDLKSRGMKIMLTLHHFTNPLWFSEMGGFEKKGNIKYFVDFAQKVFVEFEQDVDFWVTVNEPNVYVLMSYLLGTWPPGFKKPWLAYRVFNHLAIAHRQIYHWMHRHHRFEKPQVGFANHVISFDVYDQHSAIDWAFVRLNDWVFNHLFLEKTIGCHDYFGVNYYVHKRMTGSGLKAWKKFLVQPPEESRERTDLDWEVFPPGLFDALQDLNSYGVPIYVTENGISTLNDDRRARYLVSYLKELSHALESGVDVRGYFYWSLLDNFEWDKGLKARFGLLDVNFQTLKREVRGSALIYKRICEQNAIEHDLLRFIGHSISAQSVLATLQRPAGESKGESSPDGHSHSE